MKAIKYYAGSIAAIAVLVISTQQVFGFGNSNSGKDPTGGSCSSDGYSTYFDTCYGATWRYYRFPEGVYQVTIPDQGSMPGGTIGPCRDPITGETTDGYYRLGLEVYNPSIYNVTGDVIGASYGKQAGIYKNNRLSGVSGTTPLQTIGGTSISLAEARQRYEEAVKSGGNIQPTHAWDSDLGAFCYDSHWTGDFEIPDPIVSIIPGGNTSDNEPPEPSTNANGGHFYSTSTVEINEQQYDVSHHRQTSRGEDGSVVVELSTDNATFTGWFEHKLYWQNDMGGGIFAAPRTSWDTYETIDGRITRRDINTDTYQVDKDRGGSNDASGTLSRESVTVNLDPGQTIEVCHIIHYSPKYISYFETDNGVYSNPTGSSEGSSKACYKITRPKNPEGYPNSTSNAPEPKNDGTTGGTIMYTGQTAEITWNNIWAETYPTRRYAGWQEIVYTVPATTNYFEEYVDPVSHVGGKDIATGNRTDIPRNANDPCTYYMKHTQKNNLATSWPDTTSCAVVGYDDLNPGTTQTIYDYGSRQKTVVVPDYVGYKYCNSFGWKYEYWVAYDYGYGEKEWHKETKDYWNTYDATCRSISKKPSVSIWNGSFQTNGSVESTISERYNNTNVGTLANTAADVAYGSWSEFLSVVKYNVNGFGSAADFARGQLESNLIGPGLIGISPLTIANTSILGNSGIDANSVLRTRLNTYLKAHAQVISSDASSTSFGINSNMRVSDTRIYHVKGDLTIDDNIIINEVDATNNAPYSNIYHIPQVVIFVDGNVNVRSNVTQVDAWLIIGTAGSNNNGTLNTCSDFVVPQRDGNTVTHYGSDADANGMMNSNYDSRICAKQLSFNGPVLANRLVLNRSYGSDPIITRSDTYTGSLFNIGGNSQKWSSAEVFNFRADSYLWAYAQAGRYDSSYTQSYTRELAPRY